MSKLSTYEGVVEHGHVKLPPDADIPDNTHVYVLVPNRDNSYKIMSPRLADRSMAKDFVKEVIDETPNANL